MLYIYLAHHDINFISDRFKAILALVHYRIYRINTPGIRKKWSNNAQLFHGTHRFLHSKIEGRHSAERNCQKVISAHVRPFLFY